MFNIEDYLKQKNYSKDIEDFFSKRNGVMTDIFTADKNEIKELFTELAKNLGVKDIKITLKTPEQEKTMEFNTQDNNVMNSGKIKESCINDEFDTNLISDVFEMLKKELSDEKHEEVFEDKKEILSENSCIEQEFIDNVILTKKIFEGKKLEEIFDKIGEWQKNGFAKVKLNNKYNYINTEIKLLSPKQWFDWANDFYEGFAEVELNGKWNIINTEGNLLSPYQWFDYVNKFSEGFAKVVLNDNWNFINTEGNLLSPYQWFDWVDDFHKGIAKVKLNGEWNFINTEGNLFSPNQWFSWVDDFHKGVAKVKLNGEWNFIDREGQLLSPNQWFDYVNKFSEGFAVIKLNGKYNFINTEGNLLSPNQWFEFVDDFHEGFARVELNRKRNFIDREGQLLSPNQWFDWANDFFEGFAVIELNRKYNFINREGELLTPNQWFDMAYNFNDGVAKVELNGKWNVINTEGKQIHLDTYVYIKDTQKEKELNEERNEVVNFYKIFDVGGSYNELFYNAVRYICDVIHFPNNHFYEYYDNVSLEELDVVILLPNIWGKILKSEIYHFSKYLDNGGVLYVIDPESFEITRINHSLELNDYVMTDLQMEHFINNNKK